MANKLHVLLTTVLLLFILLLGAGGAIIGLLENNDRLTEQVTKRDSLLSNSNYRDSIFVYRTKKYSDVIEKYIDNCNFMIDGKEVSTQDVVRVFNMNNDHVKLLQDSLRNARLGFYDCYDSLYYYRKLVEMIRKDYGISYLMIPGDDNIQFRRNRSAADSGMILLEHYRDKLINFDSTTREWTVRVPVTVPAPAKEKKRWWKR